MEVTKHCYYCKNFVLTPAEEQKRQKLLADNGYAPAGMNGFCGASGGDDAHTLFMGDVVHLHTTKHNIIPVGANLVPTAAQSPCHIQNKQGEAKFSPVSFEE